jgi:hypothetical protein
LRKKEREQAAREGKGKKLKTEKETGEDSNVDTMG